MPSNEYWPSDTVQPEAGSVVDVLYRVHGKPAYFRGTVRRRHAAEAMRGGCHTRVAPGRAQA
eukprot:COSAG01_NODE_6454_length_3659_cov_3.918258_2_plen_62_part_00